MFTDIEGYTALMQGDEEQAVRFREKHRKIFDETTEKYQGTILQYYGDGTLSIFDSAINAVKCAIEMQLALRTEPSVPVRIGIHSGDVIHKNGEIIGDSVNVASRVESLAVAGSILISDKVQDEIKNQPFVKIRSMGRYHFKNVNKPMEVFALENEGLVVPKSSKLSGKLKPKYSWNRTLLAVMAITAVLLAIIYPFVNLKTERPVSAQSIAVLPFRNLNNNPEEDYISDGLTEDMMTVLAELGDLQVVSRKSTFQFRDSELSLKDISKALRSDLILEGSARKTGEMIRINIQLLDPNTDRQVWGKSFEQKFSSIFTVEKEIGRQVYLALGFQPKIDQAEAPTDNIQAYNYYLQGKFQKSKFNPHSVDRAKDLFEKSITLDPNYTLAYGQLANCHVLLSQVFNMISHREAWQRSAETIGKGLAINPNSAGILWMSAAIKWWYDWDYVGAREDFTKALDLDPQNSEARSIYGLFLVSMGEYDEAERQGRLAVQYDPLALDLQSVLAEILYYAGKNHESFTQCNRILSLDSTFRRARTIQQWNYLALGDFNEAISLYSNPSTRKTYQQAYDEGGEIGFYQKRLDRILKSTAPNRSLLMARLMARMERDADALDLLEKGLEERDAGFAWINQWQEFNRLKGNGRFKKILAQAGYN